MDKKYTSLKKWFKENYGDFGYDLSDVYIDEQKLKCRFDIERFGKKTTMLGLDLEKVFDLTWDLELRKSIFDGLFLIKGYGNDGDFKPKKIIRNVTI
jgi:predicted DNA-binding helix-hairpin-helix protein